MKFLRQDIVSESEAAEVGQFDVAFVGRDDLDDRSRHSSALSRAVARRHCTVKYNAAAFTLSVDGQVMSVNDLEDLFRSVRAHSILLDATTLEFPEILYVLAAYRMQSPRPRCGFFYVEPEGYKIKESGTDVVPGSAFDLSNGFKDRSSLPRFTRLLSDTNKAHLIAFLGFEGDRLLRELNSDDGHFYRRVSVVFGIPPFQPNWDLHALMANSSLLELQNTNVMYCGANNPLSAYRLLRDAHAGIAAGGQNRLVVAPFGTKPTALGVALYCLDNEVLSPIYDHPLRKFNRSYGVKRLHWYEVDLTH